MKNIEVEGGEFLLMSDEGHYAVIPAKDRSYVMQMVKSKCNDCINSYISKLPKESDYAQDGTVGDPPTKKPETVEQMYTRRTGKSWDTARSEGLIDNTAASYARLRERLMSGELDNANPKPQQGNPTAKPVSSPIPNVAKAPSKIQQPKAEEPKPIGPTQEVPQTLTLPYDRENDQVEYTLPEVEIVAKGQYNYPACVAGMCSALARKAEMGVDDFKAMTNLVGNAWELGDRAYGEEIDLSNYSNLQVNDVITLSRGEFATDKARGIPLANQHIGYISKIENGVPYVRHYIPSVGVNSQGKRYGEYFEEPINDIRAVYQYTPSRATRLAHFSEDVTYKPSNFRFDQNYSPNEVEESFANIHLNQKQDLQKILRLDAEEYDELARVAYKIMGSESNFGRSKSFLYRAMVPDIYQKAIRVAYDAANFQDVFDDNINSLSQGYGSNKESSIYNISDNSGDLKKIQKKLGIPVDGVYGPTTKKAIEEYNKSNPKNPIQYRTITEKVKDGDYEDLHKTGNYLYAAYKALGIDPDNIEDIESSTKAVMATLSLIKKKNPKATEEDLIAMYTGKKNISKYRTVYDKYDRNIDTNPNNNVEYSISQDIFGKLSKVAVDLNSSLKDVKSSLLSMVRDNPLNYTPITINAILFDVLGAKGDFTEKSLSPITMNKLKEIVKNNVEQGKMTLDYNSYFPELSRADRLAVSGGQGSGKQSMPNRFSKMISPAGLLQNFLGQARIVKIGENEYEIRDTYDFNDAGESFGVMDDLSKRAPDPYSIARSLGRNFGSMDGQGAKVRIKVKLD
jgi:hypothetical protein